MTKRQRVTAALHGEPVHRPPLAFWLHNFATENSARGLADETLRLYRAFDWDFLKPQSRAQCFAEMMQGYEVSHIFFVPAFMLKAFAEILMPSTLPLEGTPADWRMLAVTGDAKFTDVIERALYNGINSGMSLDGTLYCYRNPLAFDPPGKQQDLFDNVRPSLSAGLQRVQQGLRIGAGQFLPQQGHRRGQAAGGESHLGRQGHRVRGLGGRHAAARERSVPARGRDRGAGRRLERQAPGKRSERHERASASCGSSRAPWKASRTFGPPVCAIQCETSLRARPWSASR